MIEELLKYVRKIETKDSIFKVDNSKDVKLIKQISKYSSTKLPSLKLQFKNLIIRRDDKLTYECPMCHEESTILVGRFLSKKSKFCYNCKENNEIKRKTHSDFITKSYKDFGKVSKIDYKFNNNNKKYKVDFEIPDFKLLIEIKDLHIESGKWQAKEKAAKDWSDKNGYRYYLIFEVDILIDNYL